MVDEITAETELRDSKYLCLWHLGMLPASPASPTAPMQRTATVLSVDGGWLDCQKLWPRRVGSTVYSNLDLRRQFVGEDIGDGYVVLDGEGIAQTR